MQAILIIIRLLYELSQIGALCRLDFGDAPYAPNLMRDSKGRVLMWIWLREVWPESLLPVDYCGCLSVPRLLTLQDGDLFQEPIPELTRLRGDICWHVPQTKAFLVDGTLPLDHVADPQTEVHMSVFRWALSCLAGTACAFALEGWFGIAVRPRSVCEHNFLLHR